MVNKLANQDSGLEIAQLLVQAGVLAAERLDYALRVHAKLSAGRTLLSVLRELGLVTDEQVRETLRVNRHSVRLGSLLVELGQIKPTELDAALQTQRTSPERKKLGEVLLDLRFIEEHRLIEVLSSQLGFPRAEPDAASLDREQFAKVNARWCVQHQLVPLRNDGGGTLVAMADPMDRGARDAASAMFGRGIVFAIAGKRSILETIAATDRSSAPQTRIQNDESGVVQLVDAIILEALRAGASDIHIEPLKSVLRVRMRCDGVLVHHADYDMEIAAKLASRIKVMAGADIAERRRHQDGRIRFLHEPSGASCDIRVSIFSTLNGQKLVLRLLSRKAQLLDIRETGMAPRMLEHFLQDALDIPSGVILITGPTGSGKTTTLYGAINYLNDAESCIVTAEDPVEYVIDGIAQCSINPQLNLTFEETLRHMVRQDPDVIVLGEIRDRFSAETAIQAALTGHKVLTTFHTEDTIGGLLRLMNMDIETFMISSTVVSVVAQRLLRRICESCAEPYRASASDLRRLSYGAHDLAGAQLRIGHGCPACRHTGYTGRVGVFELLVLNEQVKEAILARRTSTEIRRISVETSGLVTLLEDGITKAAQGQTTLAEIYRHLPRLDKPRPLAELRRILGN
ncbi:MAG: Flp pilus assembly complex ATPase component TadA [Rhodocyclales bacterium]|nr:Flp pilus assembly complex ATPase component TadA [Rhodocyclales bacterium]